MIEKIFVNAHSSICVKAEKCVWFDPFMVEKETHDADVIFVTHEHYDHFSPENIEKVSGENTVIVFPESMENIILDAGYDKEKVVFMKPYETAEVCGLKVEAVPSYNVDKPMHVKERGWLGYVVTIENTKIYVCGDMDDNDEAATIKCDIVLAPCGGTYTMNAEQAAAFVNKLGPKVAIPTHYGSIVGTPEDGQIFKELVNAEIEVCFKL